MVREFASAVIFSLSDKTEKFANLFKRRQDCSSCEELNYSLKTFFFVLHFLTSTLLSSSEKTKLFSFKKIRKYWQNTSSEQMFCVGLDPNAEIIETKIVRKHSIRVIFKIIL